MTPERARQIIAESNDCSKGYPKSPQYTPAEREEVMQVWNTMPGNTSFMDALYRIMRPEQWRYLKRGDIVRFSKPVGSEDQRIANMKGDRCAVFMESTKPHGMARVAFYGDAEGLTYLVMPESLELVK